MILLLFLQIACNHETPYDFHIFKGEKEKKKESCLEQTSESEGGGNFLDQLTSS